MKRRVFLLISFYLLTRTLSAKSIMLTPWHIIESTLQHLFPKTSKFSGSSKLNMISFFRIISKDNYFDKEDLMFLISGAKRVYGLDKNFINLSSQNKENLLREFEESTFGQNWISTVMYYGFEAMLGDPIYGGNKDELGWKDIGHNIGLPRPKVKYGKNHV